MHPLAILAAAAVALIAYSNYVFYYRPPPLKSATLTTYPVAEFEQNNIANIPFFCPGLPSTPSHALARRVDTLEQGSHVIPSSPRCRRVLYVAQGLAPLPVQLNLDWRCQIRVGIPAGYSLFLPPSWQAQIVVPEGTDCTLHSSDSVGSLCFRLPKLFAPAAQTVAAMVHPYLEDAIAILDTPPTQRLTKRLRVRAPSHNPYTPVSCTPPTPHAQTAPNHHRAHQAPQPTNEGNYPSSNSTTKSDTTTVTNPPREQITIQKHPT
jgi:hypothetical protein